MNLDIVAKTDLETGKVTEIKIPPVPGVKAQFTPDEVKMYEAAGSTWNTATPWAEGPRRMGADKQGHVVWVCDWWGGSLAKIDTQTLKVTLIPLPRPESQEPYQAAVDKDHNVWVNLMNSDEVIKFDPKTSKWTEYPFPDSRSGNSLRFSARTRRQDGNHSALLPGAKSGAHDVPQQGRHTSAKTAGAAAGTSAGADRGAQPLFIPSPCKGWLAGFGPKEPTARCSCTNRTAANLFLTLFLTLTLHDRGCTVLRKGRLKSKSMHPCVR